MLRTKTLPKRVMIVAAFLLLFNPLHAQQYGWMKIAKPTTSFISGIEFVDSLNGWIGVINNPGFGRSISRTRDGGYTWQQQVAPENINVQSISFISPLQGWVVGNLGYADGYIIHTNNGGNSWQEQLRISRHFYNGVYAQSPLEALTTGSLDSFFTNAGLLVRTKDGGRSWKEQRFLTGIGKVDFVDSLRGWAHAAEGDSARFIHTKDGGKTWTIQRYDLNVLVQLRGFDFVDSLYGWAVGKGGGFDDYPVVLGTHNGGDTWKTLYEFPFDGTSRIFTDIDFADSLNGWLIGSAIVGGVDQGEIYRTTDGGLHWTVEIRDAKFFPTNGFALDHQHAWAVTTIGEVWQYRLITTVNEPEPQTPTGYRLGQNYPNPFNPTTEIEYHLPKRTKVVLTVHDILGKEVRTLLRTMQGPGSYQVKFDASGLAGGTYLYTLKTADFEETKSMTLLK